VSVFSRKLWRATESVSVMEKAVESYRKCLCFRESYGELQKVSPLWRKLWRVIGSAWRNLWRAIESVSIVEKAIESYRECLRFGESYG